jgi:hypothetical protein
VLITKYSDRELQQATRDLIVYSYKQLLSDEQANVHIILYFHLNKAMQLLISPELVRRSLGTRHILYLYFYDSLNLNLFSVYVSYSTQ